jgi:hypothetical protein
VGSVNRRIVVQASLGKKKDPIIKISGDKIAGGMAQMLENLLSKQKALSSNLRTEKKFF